MRLRVSQLLIYPVKSLMGVRVTSTKVEQGGLEYDRRWMLVDRNNRFISQRQINELVFLNTSLENDHLVITDTRSKRYYKTFLKPELYKDRISVSIWDDEVNAYEISSEANEWFTEVLNKEVKLVYIPDNVRRPLNENWSVGEGEHVNFHDECPILIVGEKSVEDLNNKLENTIEVIRFRPNIVFAGGEEYEEFYWKDLKIGEYEFRGLKPCVRCKVTTIDPKTGIQGKEPLLTLSQQKVEDQIVFGQHATVKDPAGAVIREGDEIVVETTKDTPFESL